MKELKDYQHLYLGMQVKVAGKEFINGGYIGELIGLMDEQTLLIEYMGDAWIDAKKCTPILRPLSDMTKEEVADLLGVEGFIQNGNFCPPFFQVEWRGLDEI